MPASRRARAMIFAPLSWPSRPGLAMTTRIFLATGGSVYGGEAHGHRLVSGLAEPRERSIRLPARGPGQAAPRLRPGRSRPAAPERRPRGCDRDHPLAPRPLRRPDSLGVAERLQPRGRQEPPGALAAARQRARARD